LTRSIEKIAIALWQPSKTENSRRDTNPNERSSVEDIDCNAWVRQLDERSDLGSDVCGFESRLTHEGMVEMSTKDISRTVIEPGRIKDFKVESKISTRKQRRKLSSAAIKHDADIVDKVSPKRDHVHVEQRDKLGPLKRWLRSHVGEPWNDVNSKLRTKFDFRSITGLHIVGHAFDYVDRPETPPRRYYQPPFFVDNDGILCERKKKPKKKRKKYKTTKEFRAWVGDRRIRLYSGKLWWFTVKETVYGWRRCRHGSACPNVLRGRGARSVFDKGIKEQVDFCCQMVSQHFQKHRQLSPKEMAFWNLLYEDQQREVLWRTDAIFRWSIE
jgi:hypothetical protein